MGTGPGGGATEGADGVLCREGRKRTSKMSKAVLMVTAKTRRRFTPSSRGLSIKMILNESQIIVPRFDPKKSERCIRRNCEETTSRGELGLYQLVAVAQRCCCPKPPEQSAAERTCHFSWELGMLIHRK